MVLVNESHISTNYIHKRPWNLPELQEFNTIHRCHESGKPMPKKQKRSDAIFNSDLNFLLCSKISVKTDLRFNFSRATFQKFSGTVSYTHRSLCKQCIVCVLYSVYSIGYTTVLTPQEAKSSVKVI